MSMIASRASVTSAAATGVRRGKAKAIARGSRPFQQAMKIAILGIVARPMRGSAPALERECRHRAGARRTTTRERRVGHEIAVEVERLGAAGDPRVAAVRSELPTLLGID